MWEVRITAVPFTVLNSNVYGFADYDGDLPYEGTSAEYAIIRKIFESPLPQVDGAERLSDCLQAWDLMTTCWNFDPQQRPTAKMCKTTITYLVSTPNAVFRSITPLSFA